VIISQRGSISTVGTFMFVAVGGTALHYWHGYQPEQKFIYDAPERQVSQKK